MLEKIESLKSAVEALNASTKEEVEALRIKYLSKKGEISALFNDFRNVPNEQKKEIGQKLNQLKVLATDKINALRENIETSDDADAAIDLTRPAAVSPLGTRHPISLIRNEIISIFSRL
ncbi:MAG: phenylalanine--tRNA ligase subunit alpha, partial [Muribaculaceae bacterium]|nr:phenylalanine--tRNA ligase subunit alpha [Muribaculaceae bacterium]